MSHVNSSCVANGKINRVERGMDTGCIVNSLTWLWQRISIHSGYLWAKRHKTSAQKANVVCVKSSRVLRQIIAWNGSNGKLFCFKSFCCFYDFVFCFAWVVTLLALHLRHWKGSFWVLLQTFWCNNAWNIWGHWSLLCRQSLWCCGHGDCPWGFSSLHLNDSCVGIDLSNNLFQHEYFG